MHSTGKLSSGRHKAVCPAGALHPAYPLQQQGLATKPPDMLGLHVTERQTCWVPTFPLGMLLSTERWRCKSGRSVCWQSSAHSGSPPCSSHGMLRTPNKHTTTPPPGSSPPPFCMRRADWPHSSPVVQPHDVIAQGGSPSGDHDLHLEMLAQLLADLGVLEGQLTRGHQDHGCRAGREGSDERCSGQRRRRMPECSHRLLTVSLVGGRQYHVCRAGGSLDQGLVCPAGKCRSVA